MNDPRFEVRRDPILGEEVWLARTARGLPVRVVPTDRFREVVAVVSVGYGSTDLGFESDGGRHESPQGVAHYLEHKLFEDEDLHVFERFGKRGARVNAMTGFTRTSYYFLATSQFADNFADLLHLVSRAHLTPENVEKERGIIEQELRMYEDSPEYRGFFELLRGLYAEHPVRNPVGGTVESIAGIDVAELERCHRAFYRTGNCAVAVAGPVEPAAVLDALEAWDLAAGAAPARVTVDDRGAPGRRTGEVAMDVARPRLLIGFKDRAPARSTDERLMDELATRVLLDRLLGGSSRAREALHERGLVDDSVGLSHMSERGFGFTVVHCETDTPDATRDALLELLTTPLDLDDAGLEPVRRRMLGQYVRSFDAVQSMAFAHCEEQLDGVDPFGSLARMQALDAARVRARQKEHLVAADAAWVVVSPAGG